MSTGVRRAEAAQGPRGTLLISRSLYRCKVFDLRSVPKSDRLAAAKNLLLAWSPFDESDYRIGFDADQAVAFAWDRIAVGGLVEAEPDLASLRLMPESLYRPVAQQGVRLHECLEGYEGQVWRDGRLAHSRWWPHSPSDDDWVALLRLSSIDHQGVAGNANTPWQTRAWLDCVAIDELDRSQTGLERLVVMGLACGLVAATAMQAKYLYQAHYDLQQAQMERAVLSQRADLIVRARDEAQDLARQVNTLSAALSGPQPLEVLAHLSEYLPSTGVTLRELELRGDKLYVTFELASSVQRSNVLKHLQGGGWFTDVLETRDAGVSTVASYEMRMNGLRPRERPTALMSDATSVDPLRGKSVSEPGRVTR